jgi:hypothetical protein
VPTKHARRKTSNLFDVPVKEVVIFSEPRLEEMDNFRDAKVTFSEEKYNSENESIGKKNKMIEHLRKIFQEDLGERQI